MKAVKCDRCGNYFEEEIGTINYQLKDSDDHYYHLDVCPECLDAFIEFMEGQEADHDE